MSDDRGVELGRGLSELQRDLGQVREGIGELRGEIKSYGLAIGRLLGVVETNQHANETAHRAQDDRTAGLHGDVRMALSRIDGLSEISSAHDRRLTEIEKTGNRAAGEKETHRRAADWLKMGISGAVGAAITWIGQSLSSGRH